MQHSTEKSNLVTRAALLFLSVAFGISLYTVLLQSHQRSIDRAKYIQAAQSICRALEVLDQDEICTACRRYLERASKGVDEYETLSRLENELVQIVQRKRRERAAVPNRSNGP